MTKKQRFLKPMAEAKIRSTIGAISGVAIVQVREIGQATERKDIEICVTGWSPSLNKLSMTWCATINANDDEDAQTYVLLQWLLPKIKRQRDRLDQGLALGTAAPFGVATMDGYGSRVDTEWSHILIDRGLAALMEDARKGGLGSEISDAVFDLHQIDQGLRTGMEELLEGDSTDDDGKPIGRRELHGRTLRQDIDIGSGRYDGARLWVPSTIPDTLLMAATGRMLGELVEVPAAIAGHVITGGDTREDGTTIMIEPKTASAAELLAEIEMGGIGAK